MIPLFEPNTGWLPLGMQMSQSRMSIPTWSFAMEKYPPRTIVEIGTNSGGFTVAIGIHAFNIGAAIHTFDLCVSPMECLKPLANILPITFYQADCFSTSVIPLIQQLIQRSGVTYVMCDGGNKVQEFNLFSNYLKVGDVIGAHDYSAGPWWPWSEIKIDQIRESALKHDLYSFYQDHFDMAGWLAFRKGKQ